MKRALNEATGLLQPLLVRRRTLITGAACALALPWRVARSQPKPLTLLVGFAPGGAVDFVTRLVAEKVAASLQRTVLVDNRSGAGGQLAMAALKQLPADGNSYVLTPPPVFTVYPTLYAKLPYDPQNDFEPVTTVCTYAHNLVLGLGTPAKTLPDFVAWCKANPAQASVGVPNLGSAPHFVSWLLARDAGITLEPIGYRGGGPPMIQDVLSGQVAACVSVMSNVAEFHRAGRMRIVATSGYQRSALFPNVPTLGDLGYKAAQIEEWFAIFTRAGAPAAETARFGAAVRQALGDRSLRAQLFAQGYAAQASTPAALRTDIAAETERWAKVIAQSGFKA